MQLQIKTLSNEKFTIECELSDTVKTIKEKIAAKDLKDKYEADAVKLIFSGKILEDAKTLESYAITPESFLVVVKQAVPKPQATTASAAAPSNPSGATGTQARTPNVATPAAAPPQQQPARPAPSSENAPAASQDAFLSAEVREKALRELTDMGFDRAQAELALRASFYHVERAAEYLITGNIPILNEGSTASQEGGSGQTPTGSESSTGGRRGGDDDLSELSQNPQFQALRQLIQQNPEQLQTLMQTLQATQPELYQLIEQRPQEFLELLNQADEGDDGGDDDDPLQGGVGAGGAGGHGPPGTVTITLSPQDQQAINRLQDMGFERNRVIEAFLACDRNEELAANYLLSSFD
ncbi:hypothetical protein I4U23_000909 [Adineta vaga]|nr:hypothetical protein I4U23_000909 [Adineta vaga]